MTGKRVFRLVVALWAGAAVWAVAPSSLASDMGQAAVVQVTESTYRAVLGDNSGNPGILYTHDGDSRGPGAPQHDLAMMNIQDEFESYGLTVTLEPVSYFGDIYYNVVGTKLGTVYPDQEFILGAHYDSVSNPGADDNASGTALVLECARVISQYPSDYTIRFIGFTREEQGLYGSHAYVDDHPGADILAMISTDMVAYDAGQEHSLIYGRDGQSSELKADMQEAVATYSTYQGITLSSTDGGWNGQSDHAPFDGAGYQACLFIEGDVWSNPHYHTQLDSVDTPGYIDYPFAVRMVRSMLGYLVDNAGVQVPVDALGFEFPDGHPEYAAPDGSTVVRVEVMGLGSEVPQPGTGLLHYDVGAGWQSTTMFEVSPKVYDAALPPSVCGDEVRYYFTAVSMTAEQYEAPWGAPDGSFSALSAYGLTVGFEDTFDSDPGWTTEDEWAFGQPTGGGGDHGGPDPTSGYTGNYVYGYDLNGDYDNYLPERHLTSTPIDCTGLYGTHLTFWRWLGVERPLYDHAYIRVSTNGSTWTTVWENTAEITDSEWQEIDLDVSAYVDNEPTVYLRWTMGETDVAWEYCGWNIDDVRLVTLDCTPPVEPGDGDYDDDGDVDLGDFAGFQACFGSVPLTGACASVDMNASGAVDLADVADFAGALGGPF